MSNIANPSRTDAGLDASGLFPETTRVIRIGVAGVTLALLLISFAPFTLEVDARQVLNGSVVNQLGYSALGGLALLGLFLFCDRIVVASLLRPAWLLMLAALAWSTTNALMPDVALRSFLFTLIAMIATTAVICLPASEKDFRSALAIGALATLLMSYAGLVIFPSAAIHEAGGLESQHAGLWRGVYSHKNLAGPVMAMLAFAGFYLWRSGDRVLGGLVAVFAMVFVLQTGSKTTLGLLPLVAAIVILGRMIFGRAITSCAILALVVGTGLLTLGAALSPALDSVLQLILPGTTFTGRIDLWRFSVHEFLPHAWTGFGYESFWGTDRVLKAEAPFELSWDPRLIVNSHSGYLELALWGGWATMGLGILTLVLLPLWDYARSDSDGRSRRLDDFFLMVLTFALLNSFLEAYLFQRANPIWILTWLSVVGLRLSSRFRAVREDRAPT